MVFGALRLEQKERGIAGYDGAAQPVHIIVGGEATSFVTPRDMKTCLELPKLTQALLTRGWSERRVQKVLGLNFLRVVESVRG